VARFSRLCGRIREFQGQAESANETGITAPRARSEVSNSIFKIGN
jgi:hypothetical protein